MRFIASFILLFALGNSLAKDPIHKVFGDQSDIILKASSVKVFRIQQYPVVSVEQHKNSDYVYDYEITRVYNYNSRDRFENFNKHLMDTTQFLYEDKRTCPFVGKYAIEFTKGKRTLTLVFSEAPCYKMIIFCPGSEIDKTHLDLGENNKIYEALSPLASDRL